MSELPTGWVETTLGDVVRLRGEKATPLAVPHLPFLGLEDVEAHTSRIIKYVPATDVRSAGARFSAGEILYSRLRPYLNKVVTAEVEGLASAEFLVLRPELDIQGEFIRRRIMAEDFLAFAALLDRGDRPRVNFEQIAEFSILLPPAPEQRRIVAKLDALLAGVARARKELDRVPILIAHHKQALLAAAFSGDLTREWREERGIPSAQPGKVADLLAVPIRNGLSIRGSDTPPGFPSLRLSALRSRYVDMTDVRYLPIDSERASRYALLQGDVLVSRGNGTKAFVGIASMVPAVAEPTIFPDTAFRIRLDRARALPVWFASIWNAPQARVQIEAAAKTTAGIWKVSQGDLAAVELLVPDIREQEEIVGRIDAAFEWLDAVVAEHARAATLLPKLEQAILAKAFRGELVPQDPADEPASALLERIRAERAIAADPQARRIPGRRSFPVPEKTTAMTKSRIDDDVKNRPYLANLLKEAGGATAEDLFKLADLPVPDFYKQLAWEIDNGHVRDSKKKLDAA